MSSDTTSRPTARSTELLESEFPNELLAMIFLFVRGPPSSGALSEARLVCKRWQEIVDVHLRLLKPAEPYISAYQLGFLSPPGVMPVLSSEACRRAFVDVMATLIFARDSVLHGALKVLVARHGTEGNLNLNEHEESEVYRWIDLPETRIAGNVWEDLTLADLMANKSAFHPLDVPRARALGVIFDAADLGLKLEQFGGNETHFAGWTDADIQAANDEGINELALPWLVRRKLVNKKQIRKWLKTLLERRSMYFVMTTDEYLQEQDERADRAMLILETIGDLDWGEKVLNTATVLLAADHSWTMLHKVVKLASLRVLEDVWETDATGFLQSFGRIMCGYGPKAAKRALAWLVKEGCYYDRETAITSETTDELLEFIVRDHDVLLGGGTEDVLYDLIEWILDNMPAPTSTDIIGLVTDDIQSNTCQDAVWDALRRHRVHVPWDPLEILRVRWNEANKREWCGCEYRGQPHDENCDPTQKAMEMLNPLLAAGYRLPELIEPPFEDAVLTTEDVTLWLLLVEAAAAVKGGQVLTAANFSDAFLAQAGALDAGRVLIDRLVRGPAPAEAVNG